MWTKIRLRNFRLYCDTKDVALAPLTFFIGPNSGGKSTLLKALLLLRQSAESADMQTPIVPNEPYCELGHYDDYIFQGDETRNLSLRVDWMTEADADGKKYPAGFEVDWSLNQKQGKVFVEKLEYEFKGSRSVTAMRNEQGYYHLSSERFAFNSRKDLIKRLRRFYGTSDEIDRLTLNIDPSFTIHLNWLENELVRQLFVTYYLGPLREPPKPIYPAPQDIPSDVGLSGERAGDVMVVNKDVAEQVSYWAKKLKIADAVSISLINKNFYSIRVTNTKGYESNIINVGFGVPQSLPILVQGLYLPSGSTFLVEQPEIHLNPAIQAEMGDFLVHLVKHKDHKKQLIVETHSEHILSRVRTRIAKGDIDQEMVAVYYCRATKGGGKISRLQINELGQFENWPDGFFGEEIKEAMKQTQLAFKRHNRRNKSVK